MSAAVTLEISDYFPSGFNYEGFCFNFKSDNNLEVIEFNKKNQIRLSIKSMKRDRKFTIRVLKNNAVVGITELVLPELMLLKREEKFSKIISISMVESIKKALLGKDLNKSLQFQIKAKIEYDENFIENLYGNRSSSAKQISGKKASVSGVAQIKPNYVINNRGSISVVKEMDHKAPVNLPAQNEAQNGVNSPETNQLDEFGEPETSFLDEILNEEQNQDVDKILNDFIQEYNIISNEALEETEEIILREKTKCLIPKLFELQKNYYSEFNKATNLNRRLKELLIKYNEKYRTIFKKSNRLKEALESNNIRNELTTFINKEENKRIEHSLNINRTELSTFKDLFKIKSTQEEFNDFKVTNNSNRETADKKTLLKVIENLCKNSMVKNLPEDKKIQLGYLSMKYGFKVELEVEEKSDNELPKIEEKKEITPGEKYVSKSLLSSSPIRKRLSMVKSAEVDDLDRQLEEQFVDFYSKKRYGIVHLNKISQNEYKFGSQKVTITTEGEKGENIRVKIGGVIMGLDKFLDVYAPLEEAKQVKAGIIEKFKNYSGILKALGADFQSKSANNTKIDSPKKKKSISGLI